MHESPCSLGGLLRRAAQAREREPVDDETWAGLQVAPGKSLADTAAQNGVTGLPAFRALENVLFEKHKLKPIIVNKPSNAFGIGGKARVLGRVAVPSGIAGVNGIMALTVIDNSGLPTLTQVN